MKNNFLINLFSKFNLHFYFFSNKLRTISFKKCLKNKDKILFLQFYKKKDDIVFASVNFEKIKFIDYKKCMTFFNKEQKIVILNNKFDVNYIYRFYLQSGFNVFIATNIF